VARGTQGPRAVKIKILIGAFVVEETAKRRRKRKKDHHAESPDGPKPSRFWRKLTRPLRKISKAVLPSGTRSRKREEEAPRAVPSSASRLPRLPLIICALGAGLLLAIYLRGCTSTEVVIEESAETQKVRQLMNEVVQQQQQNDMTNGMAPVAAPAAGPPSAESPNPAP